MKEKDPHFLPVPASAWEADKKARAKGRVAIFNATRPGGLDGWTMDLGQYELVRTLILKRVKEADPEKGIPMQSIVIEANETLASHPLFPKGRLTNYCRFTKVDMEARGEVERVPGSSPQRIRLPKKNKT